MGVRVKFALLNESDLVIVELVPLVLHFYYCVVVATASPVSVVDYHRVQHVLMSHKSILLLNLLLLKKEIIEFFLSLINPPLLFMSRQIIIHEIVLKLESLRKVDVMTQLLPQIVKSYHMDYQDTRH